MLTKVIDTKEIFPMVHRLTLEGEVTGSVDVFKTYFPAQSGDDVIITFGMQDDEYSMNAITVNKTDDEFLASAGGLLIQLRGIQMQEDCFVISMKVKPEKKKAVTKRRRK